MFLRLPYESIENLYVSFTLPRVNNALKWIIMRLECILALSSLGDFVSWNWRVLGSLFSLASLIYPSDASQRSRRGVQLLYPTMSGRVMTNIISISMSLSDSDQPLWWSQLWWLLDLLDPEATDWWPEPGLLRSSKLFATLIVNLSEKRNFTLSIHALYTSQIIKGEPVLCTSAARIR